MATAALYALLAFVFFVALFRKQLGKWIEGWGYFHAKNGLMEVEVKSKEVPQDLALSKEEPATEKELLKKEEEKTEEEPKTVKDAKFALFVAAFEPDSDDGRENRMETAYEKLQELEESVLEKARNEASYLRLRYGS